MDQILIPTFSIPKIVQYKDVGDYSNQDIQYLAY